MEENGAPRKLDIKRLIADIAMLVGYIVLVAGVGLFLGVSRDVFFSTAAMSVIFAICLLILPIGYFLLFRKNTPAIMAGKVGTGVSIALIAVSVIFLLLCILFSLVVDFVQPLALSTASSILLIAGAVILLVAALIQVLSRGQLTAIVVCAMLLAMMLTGVIWVNAQDYGEFNDEAITASSFLFNNGEGDFATFRIPSIIAVNHDELNEHYGLTLEKDVLYAFAEGRRNSSHDTGSIDMVYKFSTDGGETWSDLNILLSYGTENIGKYGNPTPVLDRETGLLLFPYMTGTEANNYDYDTYMAKFSFNADFTLTQEGEPVNINPDKVADATGGGSDGVRETTLMIGPGKSIQLSGGEYDGRIVVPASSGGYSFVLYSDDHGDTWHRGQDAGTGNECEAVQLPNGELVMVVRDMTGCSAPHYEQYQRLSYSNDGGETWYEKTVDTTLKSPICMASLALNADGTLLISYPDSFLTRANLTIAASTDNGKTWETCRVYSGAAGYSCITADSDGNIYLLAEIGKVNYNEVLYFARVNF